MFDLMLYFCENPASIVTLDTIVNGVPEDDMGISMERGAQTLYRLCSGEDV